VDCDSRLLETIDMDYFINTLLTDLHTQVDVLISVVVAMFFGGLIGIEREYADKPAGLRTHMLVAGAAALLVGLGDALTHRFTSEVYGDILRTDPMRIIEAIITGVSFLGAGTIFYRSENNLVKGLTTAASLLLVSGVGIAIALNQYILAFGVTLISIVVLRIIRLIDKKIEKKFKI
jgi:putative Mg2+ transporter-C (MgtC) family protein